MAPMRADARQNRMRILDAAREVLAERGINAPIDEIARRAGVGIATLYRRFPTRAELIAAAFDDKMSIYVETVERGLENPDPWDGFCGVLTQMTAMQVADKGFAELLTLTFPSVARFEEERRRAYAGLETLIEKAKAAGRLRPEFTAEDIVILLMANAGVISAAGKAAGRASPRLVAYLLQAFAATPHADLPPSPSPRQIYSALLRLDRGS